MKLLSKFIVLVAIIFPTLVFATKPFSGLSDQIFSAFRYYKNISPQVTVPTVIEIPFDEESFQPAVFAVYNLSNSKFEPNYFSVKDISVPFRIDTLEGLGSPKTMYDGNYNSYEEFPLKGETNKATIIFSFERPIESSSLYFTLDNYVALPQTISIDAMVDGKEYVVQREVRPHGGYVVFPKTKSMTWKITFSYVQPLRISEIKINDLSQTQKLTGLRFLAQPGKNYRVYFDADRYVTYPTNESGNLSSDKGVVRYGASGDILNPDYKPADYDSDSVSDLADNCISVANLDQKDSDGNFLGDACEDYDRDGVLSANDNCIDIPNVSQIDTDADNIGDACDSLDNRVTERLPWLPWVGIGIAGLVILVLFVVVARHRPEDKI